MKVRGIDFTMYAVKDLKRSIKFYNKTLGLKIYGKPGKSWAEFEAGKDILVIGNWGFDKKKVGGGATVGLAVADVKSALKELRKKGVKIIDDYYETGVCFGSTIADPDGNRIYLHQRKDGTAG